MITATSARAMQPGKEKPNWKHTDKESYRIMIKMHYSQ
jgi:hypothetical protein